MLEMNYICENKEVKMYCDFMFKKKHWREENCL